MGLLCCWNSGRVTDILRKSSKGHGSRLEVRMPNGDYRVRSYRQLPIELVDSPPDPRAILSLLSACHEAADWTSCIVPGYRSMAGVHEVPFRSASNSRQSEQSEHVDCRTSFPFARCSGCSRSSLLTPNPRRNTSPRQLHRSKRLNRTIRTLVSSLHHERFHRCQVRVWVSRSHTRSMSVCGRLVQTPTEFLHKHLNGVGDAGRSRLQQN